MNGPFPAEDRHRLRMRHNRSQNEADCERPGVHGEPGCNGCADNDAACVYRMTFIIAFPAA